MLDATLPDENLRTAVFSRIPRPEMAQALDDVRKLVRPPDDVFYRALDAHYRRVRGFLPTLLKHVSFIAAPAGEPVHEAYSYLRDREHGHVSDRKPPLAIVRRGWERHVMRENGGGEQELSQSPSLSEFLAPVHDDFHRSCMSEQELGKMLESEVAKQRMESGVAKEQERGSASLALQMS